MKVPELFSLRSGRAGYNQEAFLLEARKDPFLENGASFTITLSHFIYFNGFLNQRKFETKLPIQNVSGLGCLDYKSLVLEIVKEAILNDKDWARKFWRLVHDDRPMEPVVFSANNGSIFGGPPHFVLREDGYFVEC